MKETDKILIGHGSGGRLTRELVNEVFIRTLGDRATGGLDDGAVLPACGDKLVYTTDSYVVSPLEFPGGDIGSLAVSGTVNDLAVMGARPLYLSLGAVLEEGLEIGLLKKMVASIARTAEMADVRIMCGDTKVVERGKGDKIFFNTSGIGRLEHELDFGSIHSGDKVLINGTIGDHGMTLLTLRKGFPLQSALTSDCAPLNRLIHKAVSTGAVKWMRDPTRGGVATALTELVEGRDWCVELQENSLPHHPAVEEMAELLGLDPLYSANEGKVLMVVDGRRAEEVLARLKTDTLGKKSAIIGDVTDAYSEKVILHTAFGTRRTLGMLNSDPLPRIC
ncbi:hydrogenase expression/formation protein HypE [Fibrobacterota bacterium]